MEEKGDELEPVSMSWNPYQPLPDSYCDDVGVLQGKLVPQHNSKHKGGELLES